MNAASQNLVPVTLELGGKSPVVISEGADMKVSAKRIMFGKTMNAGQICLAPDYVLIHKSKKDEFIKYSEEAIKEFYPTIKDNDDYTSIINERHFDRINSLIDDAKEKGADINQINPAGEDFSQQEFYKIPPTIITNTTEDMTVMHEEIFGPVLPVVEFDDVGHSRIAGLQWPSRARLSMAQGFAGERFLTFARRLPRIAGAVFLIGILAL